VRAVNPGGQPRPAGPPRGRQPPPPPSDRRPLILAVSAAVLVLLGLAAWFYTLPYLAVYRIEGAVKRNDAAALAREVDFEALRSNLKVQLHTLPGPIASTLKGRLAEALGSRIVSSVANKAVDLEITPNGLAWLLLGKSAAELAKHPLGQTPTPAPAELQNAFGTAACAWETTERFVVTLRSPNGRQTVMLLKRSGLEWRLVDIHLAR
jgi:hypothetical protein